MDECYLINIVNNDFHETHEIFKIFDGLVVTDIDRVFEDATTNGHQSGVGDVVNGKVDEAEKAIAKGHTGKAPFPAGMKDAQVNGQRDAAA